MSQTEPTDATEYRFTITITPMSEADLQQVIDDIRKRFGQKHLIHVIGKQSSGTPLADAPGGTVNVSQRMGTVEAGSTVVGYVAGTPRRPRPPRSSR